MGDHNGEHTAHPSLVSETEKSDFLALQESPKNFVQDVEEPGLDEAKAAEPEQKNVEDLESGVSAANALAKAESQPLHSVFSKRWKIFIISMSALGAFISPISANLYFPALNTLAAYYSVSSSQINLTLTSYMIFQGLAPMFMGDFADQQGHRAACCLCMIIYVGANVGLALQNSYAALLVLRCLQSTGASGTVALRNAVIAEIVTPAERGTYLGIMQAGTLIAPALGPVLGGVLTETLGWRSTFWFLVILCGTYTIPYVLFVPETNRRIVGNGSIPPTNWWEKSVLDVVRGRRKSQDDRDQEPDQSSAQAEKRRLKWPRPWRTLVIMAEKDVAMVLLYSAILFGAFYGVIASIPVIFARIYGFNDIQVGLCYIPVGVGCAVGALGNGKLLNHTYRRIAKENGFPVEVKRRQDLRHFPIEKARLQAVLPCVGILVVLLIVYGWLLESEVNLAGPLILQFFMGMLIIASFSSLQNLMVDIFPGSAATVTAAGNLSRCLLGAGATALISPMLNTMGDGWSFTLIALIIVAISPVLLVELKKGPKWREERHVRLEHKKTSRSEETEKKKHVAPP